MSSESSGNTKPLSKETIGKIRSRLLKPADMYGQRLCGLNLLQKTDRLRECAPRDIRHAIEEATACVFPSHSEYKIYSDKGAIALFGLFAGYMYARNTDPRTVITRLNEDFLRGLNNMCDIQWNGCHEADDFLRLRGRAMGRFIASRMAFPEYLLVSASGTKIAYDRNKLASDAFGWPINIAHTVLMETAIRETNDLRSADRRSLQRDISALADPYLVICYNEDVGRFERY